MSVSNIDQAAKVPITLAKGKCTQERKHSRQDNSCLNSILGSPQTNDHETSSVTEAASEIVSESASSSILLPAFSLKYTDRLDSTSSVDSKTQQTVIKVNKSNEPASGSAHKGNSVRKSHQCSTGTTTSTCDQGTTSIPTCSQGSTITSICSQGTLGSKCKQGTPALTCNQIHSDSLDTSCKKTHERRGRGSKTFGHRSYKKDSATNRAEQCYYQGDLVFQQAFDCYQKLKLGITLSSSKISTEFALSHPKICQLAYEQQYDLSQEIENIVDDPNIAEQLLMDYNQSHPCNQPHRALRFNSMTNFSIEQVMVNCMLTNALNILLQAEMDCFLGFERYAHAQAPTNKGTSKHKGGTKSAESKEYKTRNLRNGFYTRNIVSLYGYLSIKYPRDRKCAFVSHIIHKKICQLNLSEELVLSLYTCTTDSQFAMVLRQLCDKDTTETYIKRLAQKANERFSKWKKHKIPEQMSFMLIHNLCFKLKTSGIQLPNDLQTVQIWQAALGILPNGTHQVLSINPITANPAFVASLSYTDTLHYGKQSGRHVLPISLTASLWNNILNDLMHRGLKKVTYVCLDGAHEAMPRIKENLPDCYIIREMLPVAGECKIVTGPE